MERTVLTGIGLMSIVGIRGAICDKNSVSEVLGDGEIDEGVRDIRGLWIEPGDCERERINGRSDGRGTNELSLVGREEVPKVSL